MSEEFRDTDVPTVQRSRVGDRILITESGGTGCVAFPDENVDHLIAKLEAIKDDA